MELLGLSVSNALLTGILPVGSESALFVVALGMLIASVIGIVSATRRPRSHVTLDTADSPALGGSKLVLLASRRTLEATR